MTSRERLLKVLRRETPDRAPISTYELAGWNSKSFENREPSYRRLMDAIRERADCTAMWNPRGNSKFLCTAHPVPSTVEELREGHAAVKKIVFHTPRGDLQRTTKVLDGLMTQWTTEPLCKNTQDVDRAMSVPFQALTFDASDFPRIRAEVGDHGIIMASLADALCRAAELMEFGNYTVWAMTETEHFARTVEALHEQTMENLRRLLQTNVVDLYRICGPEYATPPYLPPEFFRRFVLPQNREMTELIHSHGGKVRIHCHGRIARVLDMIAETGADATNPCEAPPDGDISLAEVKRRAGLPGGSQGGRLCLFGNLQLKLLEHGTREDVRAAVKVCMDSAKAGGGYVIMPTSAPINIPLAPKTEENYLAFLDAALEYGR